MTWKKLYSELVDLLAWFLDTVVSRYFQNIQIEAKCLLRGGWICVMDAYIYWWRWPRCRVMTSAGIVSLDCGRVGSGGRVEKWNNVCSDGEDVTKKRGYLHPCRWAMHWTGRSWQQGSVQGRKHHLWDFPAHCHLVTSSWWSWGREDGRWKKETEGRSIHEIKHFVCKSWNIFKVWVSECCG